MRWLICSAGFQQTTTTCVLRLFGTRSVLLAPKRAVAPKANKRLPATRRKTLPATFSLQSSSSLTPAHGGKPGSLSGGKGSDSRGSRGREGAVPSGKGTDGKKVVGRSEKEDEEEERRLAEGDTRLAMRMLMQHHFLYQGNARRPEEQRMEEERQRLREKHRARMERIEQKTRNSMELGPDVSVDGILPLYRRDRMASTVPTSKPMASWRRLNPVEVEADDSSGASDDGCSLVEELLTKPDISVYDAEHDHRIRSEEVLEEEQKHRRDELKSGEATKKLWTKEELETGGGLTPQRVVQSQMFQDEDQDFAVEAYSCDND